MQLTQEGSKLAIGFMCGITGLAGRVGIRTRFLASFFFLLLGSASLPILNPTSAEAATSSEAEALRDECQKLIGGTFRIHFAQVVIVVTDGPDAVAESCIKHLYEVLPKMRSWSGFPPDSPVPEAVVVALFNRREDCERFVKSRGAPAVSSFTYLHHDEPSRRVIAAFVMNTQPLLARLRHESLNALLHAWIAHPPLWLSEGLGECLEDAILNPQGRLFLGPPRGHLRDLRERILDAQPSPFFPMKELITLDQEGWERRSFVAYTEAWSFLRYIQEDPALREARLLKKLWAALSPEASEKENTRRAAAVFLEEEWAPLEKGWRSFIQKLPETPAEEPYRKARECMDQRDYAAALPLIDEAVRLDPGYERLHFFRGLSFFHIGQFTLAVTDFNQALELFPEYHAARFQRGRAYAAMGQPVEARKDFEACMHTSYEERAKKELEGLKNR